MMVLGARTAYLQLLIFGSNIALARLLEPRDFGVFNIVQFALAFFTLFGDAGLGGSLIQKKREPTQTELSTVFYIHLAITAVVLGLVFVVAGYIRQIWPTLPADGPWLLRAISLTLVFTMLRVVPSILMERHLEFTKLALLEMLHISAFYVSVVVMAVLGMGAWSFIIGLLIEGLVALVAAFALRPWRPSLRFRGRALRPLLKFGIAFQAKGAISFFNSAVTPLYAGATLGAAPLGLINWGQATAYFPLRLVEIVGRVSFPLYSRLSSDPEELRDALERNVQICAVGALFFVGMVFGIGPAITEVVFGAKWLPGLPALYVFAAAISIGFVSPIIGAAFDGIGEPQIFVRLSVMWSIVNWSAVLLTTPLWPEEHKVLGFSIAYASHVVVGNVAVLIVLRRKFPKIRLLRRVIGPLLGGLAVAAVGRLVLLPQVTGVGTFIGAVLASMVVFVAVLALIDREAVRRVLRFFRRKKL